MKTKAVRLLKLAKQRLTRDQWSSYGGGNGIDQFCAITALDNLPHCATHDTYNNVCDARSLLSTACKKLHRHTSIVRVNDGGIVFTSNSMKILRRYDNKSADERFELIHGIYDKAIELGKQ